MARKTTTTTVTGERAYAVKKGRVVGTTQKTTSITRSRDLGSAISVLKLPVFVLLFWLLVLAPFFTVMTKFENGKVLLADEFTTSILIESDTLNIVATFNNTLNLLDLSGNIIWSNSFGNTQWGVDFDNDGNIYVSGWDRLFKKYDPLGNQIFSISYPINFTSDLRDLKFNNDHIYLSIDNFDYAKYDLNGNLIWKFTNHTSSIYNLAFDNDDNIGSVSEDGTFRKVSPNGSQICSFNAGALLYSVTSDGSNWYIGYQNGDLRKLDNQCNSLSNVSLGSFIYDLKFYNNHIYVASSTFRKYSTTLSLVENKTFATGIRGLDFKNDLILLGLTNGTFLQLDNNYNILSTISVSGTNNDLTSFRYIDSTVINRSYYDIMENARTAQYANPFEFVTFILSLPSLIADSRPLAFLGINTTTSQMNNAVQQARSITTRGIFRLTPILNPFRWGQP
jgi:hypothetical protein